MAQKNTMASPDSLAQKIINLENEIEGYKTELNDAIKAGNDKKIDLFGGLITACRNDLAELRKQQNAQGNKPLNSINLK